MINLETRIDPAISQNAQLSHREGRLRIADILNEAEREHAKAAEGLKLLTNDPAGVGVPQVAVVDDDDGVLASLQSLLESAVHDGFSRRYAKLPHC
jgi:hypothetical protein